MSRLTARTAMLALLLGLLLPCGLMAGEAAKKKDAKPRDLGKTLLWKVTGKGGTAWVLGSIHLAKPSLYPADAALYKAFDKADALAVEADVSDKEAIMGMAMEVMVKGMYQGGDSVEKHLSKKTLAMYRARKKKGAGSMPPMILDMMKPWVLSTALMAEGMKTIGCSPEAGIDMHFLKRAHAKKKPIKELEGAAFQLALLSGFDDKTQDLLLRSTLKELDNIGKFYEQMAACWTGGDLAFMDGRVAEAIGEEPELKTFYKKLLDDRNVGMAEKIDGYLRSGKKHFVIVGAAHLGGKMGLLKLLRNKKCIVTQVAQQGKAKAADVGIKEAVPLGGDGDDW